MQYVLTKVLIFLNIILSQHEWKKVHIYIYISNLQQVIKEETPIIHYYISIRVAVPFLNIVITYEILRSQINRCTGINFLLLYVFTYLSIYLFFDK